MVTKAPRPPPHPFLYFVLFLPFGATAGYVMVTIGYLASKAHIPDGTVAALVAMNTLPHTWKFLWAPAVDALWTGRRWYVSTNLVSSAAIIALGFIPITSGNVGILEVVIFVNGLATTFIGMCTEWLMAHLTPPEQRGRAAGWSQAGNLGGATVGGLGLLIAEHTAHAWVPAVVVGSLLLGCSLALLLVEEPPRPDRRGAFLRDLRDVGRDLWGTVASRGGVLALILCFLPLGAGGAQGLFSAIAGDWRASAGLVSVANGLVSGGAAIVGCLIGGRLSDGMDRRGAYALAGVLLAAVAFGMAFGPRSPVAYAAFVVAYSLVLGICYATFTGFVLEIIGKGAAATKYNVFASLSNIPIYYMTRACGWTAQHQGRTRMLLVDGAAGVVGALLLLVAVALLRRRKVAPALAA